MTVGMAALSEVNGGEPKVILSSDRMVTTRQQSRIEHEHPETKLREFGTDLQNTHLMGVIAGSVQLAEVFENQLNYKLNAYTQQQGEEPWVNTSAQLASQVYRDIVQDKIENRVLSAYGLELDDLSRQHQFQDDFLSDILSEISQVRQRIYQNMTVLIGGVGPDGAGIYQVTGDDLIPKNDMGYCAIGSGAQPAESEFIKSDYERSSSVEYVLSTVAAANYQAKKASGVGGDPDFVVVGANGIDEIEDRVEAELMRREEEIAEIQRSVKANIRNHRTINRNS